MELIRRLGGLTAVGCRNDRRIMLWDDYDSHEFHYLGDGSERLHSTRDNTARYGEGLWLVLWCENIRRNLTKERDVYISFKTTGMKTSIEGKM